MSKDYYSILGLTKSATPDDIKKAYRKLAIANHPDKHPKEKAEYEKKFREINEAYSVLSDAAKKAQYDKFGSADGHQGGFGGHGGFGGFGGGAGGFGQGGFDFGDINDIFNNFFNQGGANGSSSRRRQQESTRPRRGSDLRYKIEVTLEEAFNGIRKTVEFKCLDKCGTCHGTGSSTGKREESTCSACNGHGVTRITQGFFIMEQTCSACGGTGSVIKNPCKTCRGYGMYEQTKRVDINIPQGISDGVNLKIEGAGEPGERSGPNGDLYVIVSVKRHKIFERSGNDLICEIPITFTKAALGGEVTTIGIDKRHITFDVSKGTQNGQQFAVSGEGMSIMGRPGKRGNLIVKVNIETPVKLSKKQEELLKEFESLSDPSSNPKSHGFLDSIKGLFGL